MNKPFFSVIVPAHNSAEYIRKCLRSVTSQSFRSFELIVVCDACTDNTYDVAQAYADKTIVTDFGMDGMARNAGIDAAEGKWILFLDDDDWWIHDYVLEEVNKVAERFGDSIDLILFDFIWKNLGYAAQFPQKMNIAVWSKAFRREFLGNTRFPAIPFTSDQPFMDEICAKGPIAVPTGKLMYYYNYMRKGSQTEINARPDGAVPEA